MAIFMNTRRQITNLNEEIQLRELNRQLDWIWQHLQGGLTLKNLSQEGKQQLTEFIETVVENMDE